MRDLDPAVLDAIVRREVMARDLLWITVRDFDDGTVHDFGFSTFVRNLEIPVVDGRTGATVARVFTGVSGAFKVGSIALTADITVRTVDVDLPAIDATVAEMLRAYDVRNAPVQIYRAYLNPDTRSLLAAAKARFVGFVNKAPITTPAAGGTGSARLSCVSTTRELTRASTDVCSHESQLARSGGADDFYIDTAVVGDWELFWGKARAGGGVVSNGGFQGGIAR